MKDVQRSNLTLANNDSIEPRVLRRSPFGPEPHARIPRCVGPGANGVGRGIAQVLVAAGEDVVDVPSTLATKVWVLSTGGGRKTHLDDAKAVGLTALYHTGLDVVHREDQTTMHAVLVDVRGEPGGVIRKF